MTAPDRIWAGTYDDQSSDNEDEWAMNVPYWREDDRDPHFETEYIRRDPAVLAADPMVQALVGAVIDEAMEAFESPPRASAVPWRDDGVCCKHDRCEHGIWHYEDCHDCSMSAVRNLRPDAAASLDRMLRDAKNEALEQAAQAADAEWCLHCDHRIGASEREGGAQDCADRIAAAIRNLKDQAE